MTMTALPTRLAKRPLAWSRALLPAVLLGLLPLGAVNAAPQNTVQSIVTVQTKAPQSTASQAASTQTKSPQARAALAPALVTTYSITLTSTDDFPMTDSIVTLNIGGKEFTSSTYGPGGAMNTLVFSLTRDQFLSLKTGDKMAVYYGQDNAAIPAAQWNFGTLNLSLLNKPAAAAQTAAKGK